MAFVTRSVVEKTGIDMAGLVHALVKAAAAEFNAYYYYTILRMNLTGVQGGEIKDFAETARMEDRNHFEALVLRIYELGGKLPQNMREMHDMAACPPPVLPPASSDVDDLLQVLVAMERCAVREYSDLCSLTVGKDHRTYELIAAILNEEVNHESWFAGYLGEGPSGYLLRRGEVSPFVGRFLC